MRTYRFAILGCGPRGRSQARAIKQHPRADLVALCDVDAARLNAMGDEFGVAARYSDFERMIREEQPDVVNIPTATRFHGQLAEAVLRLGCHVDVEKPLTLTLEEADRVIAAQRASGKKLALHHQAAVHPPARKIRDLVRHGFIGQPTAMRIRDKGYYGGFGILHQGCHALALAITILGPAQAVSAHMITSGRRTTVDDVFTGPYGYGLVAGEHLTCLYEMPHGVYLVNEEHQRLPVDSSTIRFEIVGTEGALALDHALPRAVYHSSNPHWKPSDGSWSAVPLTPDERTIAGMDFTDERVNGVDLWLVDEWVQALDEGRDLVVSGDVGLSTMEMIHGAYTSHAEGRRVELPQADRSHPLKRWLEREGHPAPGPAPVGYKEWLPWAQAQANHAL